MPTPGSDHERASARIVEAYAALNGARLSDLERGFIDQAAADWSADDLADWSARDLAAAASALWRAGAAHQDQAPWIGLRAIQAPEAAHILEIVQPDAPFLVASVMGAIVEAGARVRAMIHPVIETGGGRRSLMQVILAPLANPEALTSAVEAALADVWAAVRDFEAMRQAMRGAIVGLERASRGSDEERAFLRWLDEGRFVFLGTRAYAYPAAEDATPEPIADTGLGVLRNPDLQIVRQANDAAVDAALAGRRGLGHPAVTVAKANLISRVHRRVHMDYVGVERFDASGRAVGEVRFIGLFTAEAYQLPVDQTPLIRAKIHAVFERAGMPKGGHSASRLRNVLNGWPRDDLFQIPEDELLKGALQALRLQDRPRVDLFVRRDPFERFASVLVYVPRERFDYEFVEAAGRLLAPAFGGQVIATYPEFGDAPIARIQYVVQFDAGPRRDPDLQALREDLADLAQTWLDRLEEAARDALSQDQVARALALADTAPAGYRARNGAADALADIAEIEALKGESGIGVRMFRRPGEGRERARFKLYARKAEPALADVAPILEHMGLKALREEGFALGGRSRVFVQEYLVEDRSGEPLELKRVARVFEDAVAAIWAGQTESDGFNRLVLELGVSWREAALMRALARYRQQSGLDPSQLVQEQALADHPLIAELILELFAVRFDPARNGDLRKRQDREAELWGQIVTALQSVRALDADRALRRLALLVRACVRTNFYQTGPDGRAKPYISFKVASRELEDLPAPKPFREIFVSAPSVDGVHLRFGPVARGGLRWSDRRDDFRTEVLGLVKAQQVKNAVIVPVGSKGGFFPKRLPRHGGPEAVREEAIGAYKTFLFGLLDLTDNLSAEGAVIHPEQTVIHDGEDPYLVVAADKGTASFSDIANGVAQDYGFWLGDAFASGGSAGYDHKEMGITARGAWEAVKRHFREMGKDIQTEPFTVIGVGDMSGDVFGNGMLLSRQIRLLAAFDHRHIFIDPDPDPAAAWTERQRLFHLPRSSWDDYDKALISRGGGVFARSAKSVTLTAEMKAMLRSDAEALTPSDLIQAILKAEAELFYLGGIGTYVKAASESHAEVGDKLNDAVRINAADLRCRVVGEGANLGFTQAGRIEFALAGGRLNTDAIDNSAGVDSSDHEVNIKILTGAAERGGRLTREDRNRLLASMTDEVAAKVLVHNYDQTLALSLMEAAAAADLESHAAYMTALETEGRLDRQVEGLPDAKVLATRAAAGRGLTRPELAVLLAYGKLDLFDDVIASNGPDDPFFARTLKAYFPTPLGVFEAEMAQHRLRREIIATVIVNEIVNRCGPTFASRLRASAECDAAALVTGFEAARAILDIDPLWDAVAALDGQIPAEGQLTLFRELVLVQRGQTYWLARKQARTPATVQALIDQYRPAVQDLRDLGQGVLSAIERQGVSERLQHYLAAGAPEDLARAVAELRPLTTVGDLVDLARACDWPVDAVSRAYHRVGGEFCFDMVRAGAGALAPADAFERIAVRRLVEDLLDQQTALTKALFGSAGDREIHTPEAVEALVADFEVEHAEAVKKARAVTGEIAASPGGWTFAKLTIANAALKGLASA